MYQFYVVEIQKMANGSYGHIVYTESDEDYDKARLKGESKYYTVLSAAAISALPEHGAILMTSKCEPILRNCYTHTV